MNHNSSPPLVNPGLQDLADGLGVPQFQGDSTFYVVSNGLIIQGGKATFVGAGTYDVAFPAPFTQQILTIQLQRIDSANQVHVVGSPGTTLNRLRVQMASSGGSIYWFAMGV